MEIRSYKTKEELKRIEELYIDAFPEIERKPFELMAAKIGEGVEMLAFEEEGSFAGLAIMLVYESIALLDYFAIMPNLRGKGLGGKALAMLKERYNGKALLIEIEDPDEECDNKADRVRRKGFYLRNGMVEMPYKVWFYGTKMLALTSGVPVGFEAHNAVYKAVLGPLVAKRITLA